MVQFLKDIKLSFLVILVLLSVETFSQVFPYSIFSSKLYYIYTPITGNANTLASGIFVVNSNDRTKTNKADTLASKKSPLNYTWVEYYSYNPEDLSDSTQIADSTTTLSRYFDVSLFPFGSQMSYRHSIIERKANGVNFYKTDTLKTYTVKEIAGNPLYDADGFPLFDSEGVLLFPAEE